MLIRNNAPRKSPQLQFRGFTVVVALVLGAYCLWVLSAELESPRVTRLPTNPQDAARAATQRSDATWAARIGLVRGDLWATYAFAFAGLLWTGSPGSSELTPTLERARARAERAIEYKPIQSDVWLLLAGLASRYGWTKPVPSEALRMSYYTGPNDRESMPLRASIAAQLPAADDELQRLARRELHILLTRGEKQSVMQAYHSASPSGRRVIEEAVRQDDPDLLKSMGGVPD